MTLRTSIIITGDTAGGQKALADLGREMDRTGVAAEGLASSERSAEAATTRLEGELRRSIATTGAVEQTLNQASRAAHVLFAAEQNLEAALASRELAQRRAATAAETDADAQLRASAAVAAADARVVSATLAVERAQRGLDRSGGLVVRSMGEQAQGARMLGQQFQDMAVMGSMSSGSLTDVMRIFTSQIGQTAYALDQMGAKGSLGQLASFMNTPWGAAASGAAIVLLPFIAKLFEAGSAAEFTADSLDKAAESADSFGNAQSLLGKIIDLTTGKLKTHNTVLIETIKLQAQLNLVESQKKINAATGFSSTGFGSFDNLPANDLRRAAGPSADDVFRQKAQDLKVTNVADQLYTALGRVVANAQMANRDPSGYAALVNGQLERSIGVLDSMAESAQFTGKALGDAKAKLLELANAGTDKAAALMAIRVGNGGPVPDELTPYAKDKKKKTPKPKSTEARDRFGRDAADRIASITAAFDATPTAVQQAEKAIRQLDSIIGDLGRKKPPNFGALITSAEQAKGVVENGLIRSIGEAFEKPKTLAEKAAQALQTLDAELGKKSKLLKDGLIDQAGFDEFGRRIGAARAQIEDGLNRPFRDYVESQHDALAVQGMLAQGRYYEAEALRQILQLERQIGPLDDAHRAAILDSVKALAAEIRATEILHQKNQMNVEALGNIRAAVNDATQAFVRGDLGQFIKTPRKLLDAFMTLQGQKLFERLFGDMFRQLEDEVNGTSVVRDASARMAGAVDTASKAILDLGAAANQSAGALRATPTEAGGIGVVGGGNGGEGADITVTGRTRKNELDVFSTAIERSVGQLTSLFMDPDKAKALGKSIGTYAGKGLEGAATGTMIAGLGNALGIKVSTTGASIGGAAGKLSGIPGADIIGSIAGGLIGNLFTKPAYGTASLSNANSAASLRGRAGAETGAGSAAQQVQSGLQNIAEQLGGALGNFAVSIGTFDGKWRVSTTGFGGQLDSKTARGQGLHDFGKDGEQAAIAFAIQDAISDGAITGLSAAVQKAIRSNPDINKALQEALKVADVEQLLGGLPAQLTSAFRDFEKQAADRVRIAQQYGFDLVKIEQINAKERLNLQKQLLDQQVGSLQRLVDEMTSGSLFEGTSVDRRSALLADIEKAKADLNNGVDGAADKLATLFDQLNSVSKDVYGTTGGFATDRSAILDQARAAIAKANADIAKAQAQAKGSDPALVTTNAALDENNDQNAKIIEALRQSNTLLAKLGLPGGSSFNLTELARTS